MPNYVIFEGNFKQLIDKLAPECGFYEPMDKATYRKQLNTDIHRGHYLSFDKPIINFASRLFSDEHYEGPRFYNQGGLNGQFLEALIEATLFKKDKYLQKKTPRGDPNPYTSTLFFSYLDDKETPCAFAIERLGLDNDSSNPHKYVIWHIQNSTASADQKHITMIIEESLFGDMAAPTLSKETIAEERIFSEIKSQIGSRKVHELVSSLLENGQLSKKKMDALSARIKTDTNLDNRDIRQKILQEWLKCEVNKKRRKKIDNASKDDINFFETSRFESLLFEEIKVTESKEKDNLYKIQLRYLISNIDDTLTENDKASICSKLIQHNPNYKREDIHNHIQHAYAHKQYHKALYELDRYIHECEQPYRCVEANTLLEYCKKKLDFDTKTAFGQDKLITLIRLWKDFENYPDTKENQKLTDKNYQLIEALYDLFRFRKPDRNHILQTPDQARITWILEQNPQSFTFDPQGRIIYDTVDHKGYRVTVSKDIFGIKKLQETYVQTVKTALLAQKIDQAKADNILALLEKLPSTATIRPLQQELHIFLSQIAHECQQTYQHPHFNENDCQKVLDTTLQHASKLVMQDFARALINASKDNQLNVASINNTLNTAWSVIARETQYVLHKAIATQLESPISNETTATKINCPLLRGSSTPLVHTDHRLGLASWVDPRHPSPKFTHSVLKSCKFNHKNTTITGERERTQAIMPTVSYTQDFDQYQQAVNEQLTYTSLFYSFMKSFTYHLFPGFTEITPKNLEWTLLTVHGYNRSRLKLLIALRAEGSLLAFCDTLSMMPTHRPLGYDSYEFSGIGNEATLITEIALIQQLTPEALNLNQYKAFLLHTPTKSLLVNPLALFRSTFFSKTKEGRQTRGEIKDIKATWQDIDISILRRKDPNDIEKLLTLCLKKVMAYDLHFGSEFNTLTQALSLAQNKQALVAHGDNSRASYFLGLSQLFDQPTLNDALNDALERLASVSGGDEDNYTQAKEQATLLQNCLKQLYAEENTYGAAKQAIAINDPTLTTPRLEIPKTAQDMIDSNNRLQGSYSRVIAKMPGNTPNYPSVEPNTIVTDPKKYKIPPRTEKDRLLSPEGSNKPPRAGK